MKSANYKITEYIQTNVAGGFPLPNETADDIKIGHSEGLVVMSMTDFLKMVEDVRAVSPELAQSIKKSVR